MAEEEEQQQQLPRSHLEESCTMKARLVVNNLILELSAQTVAIRSVRRNNGQITWVINEPFLQGSLLVYWEVCRAHFLLDVVVVLAVGLLLSFSFLCVALLFRLEITNLKKKGQTVQQNVAWPRWFPRWYLLQRYNDRRDIGIQRELCLRAEDLPPHMPGNYVPVSLNHGGQRYSLNFHTLAAYLRFGELPGDRSTTKNYFVVSHLCSHRDCFGGINGDFHVSIEPQSINMQRISCWNKYLACV